MKEIISIALVGLMGSGKTTIGNFLARHLNLFYIDSDIKVEAKYKASIDLTYYLEGELSFRIKEESLIGTMLIKTNIILATGGGSVVHIDICKSLLDSNIVLWVKIGIKEQSKRVVAKQRPLTLVIRISLYKILDSVIKERNKLYLKVLNKIINVNKKPYNIILNKTSCLM
ncbi:shikimate kinase [Candidatus Tremblaya phenacola]|uniref:shikimate kinase n=1 Tax=Candidatus Tremblayella phenacoccinincola TaxID=1010676 RepID=UPI00132F528A|nr:shikimate kinase [Candidatus Tremblaya phenacola]KAH0998236.1 Shikimate kinase I [Candidatus Tremblaya phenacola]